MRVPSLLVLLLFRVHTLKFGYMYLLCLPLRYPIPPVLVLPPLHRLLPPYSHRDKPPWPL